MHKKILVTLLALIMLFSLPLSTSRTLAASNYKMTIHYYLADGSCSTETINVPAGTSIYSMVSSKANRKLSCGYQAIITYTVTGSSSSSQTALTKSTKMPSSAMLIFVHINPITAKVTFNMNNSSTGNDTVYTRTSSSGQRINQVRVDPVRTGYVFLGWSSTKNASTGIYRSDTTIYNKSSSGYTLYAQWIKVGTNRQIDYTVTKKFVDDFSKTMEKLSKDQKFGETAANYLNLGLAVIGGTTTVISIFFPPTAPVAVAALNATAFTTSGMGIVGSVISSCCSAEDIDNLANNLSNVQAYMKQKGKTSDSSTVTLTLKISCKNTTDKYPDFDDVISMELINFR